MYQISPSNWMLMYCMMLIMMKIIYYLVNYVEKDSITMMKKIKIYVK
nr:ATP synthase F0 subunit 8 [Stigmaeopsis continentalis]WKW93601.1 ATP synthase F0 subunit 8 [Stigmaeopsis continentalis]